MEPETSIIFSLFSRSIFTVLPRVFRYLISRKFGGFQFTMTFAMAKTFCTFFKIFNWIQSNQIEALKK